MRLNRTRTFRIVALAAAILAYATIVVGGTVRAMGAGLACPDWPLCHGSIVPNLSDPSIAVEYFHRLVAALTALFVLLMFFMALFWSRSDLRIVTLSLVSLATLAINVTIGALTIASRLDVWVVTAHLAFGTATFAFALTVAMISLLPPAARVAEPAPSG